MMLSVMSDSGTICDIDRLIVWLDDNDAMRSNSCSSLVDLLLNKLVESVVADSLSSVSSNCMNDLNQLVVIVSVFQLVADVSQVVEVELSLSLNVQKGEVGPSSFFSKGTALNKSKVTSLAVTSLRKLSKSRAAPPVPSLISLMSLKTNSYLVSSPRVLAVWRSSLVSALLCLGSA